MGNFLGNSKSNNADERSEEDRNENAGALENATTSVNGSDSSIAHSCTRMRHGVAGSGVIDLTGESESDGEVDDDLIETDRYEKLLAAMQPHNRKPTVGCTKAPPMAADNAMDNGNVPGDPSSVAVGRGHENIAEENLPAAPAMLSSKHDDDDDDDDDEDDEDDGEYEDWVPPPGSQNDELNNTIAALKERSYTSRLARAMRDSEPLRAMFLKAAEEASAHPSSANKRGHGEISGSEDTKMPALPYHPSAVGSGCGHPITHQQAMVDKAVREASARPWSVNQRGHGEISGAEDTKMPAGSYHPSAVARAGGRGGTSAANGKRNIARRQRKTKS